MENSEKLLVKHSRKQISPSRIFEPVTTLLRDIARRWPSRPRSKREFYRRLGQIPLYRRAIRTRLVCLVCGGRIHVLRRERLQRREEEGGWVDELLRQPLRLRDRWLQHHSLKFSLLSEENKIKFCIVFYFRLYYFMFVCLFILSNQRKSVYTCFVFWFW